MTRKEALEIVNESLIDQDTKFTREINALFKQEEAVELLQNAYDNADDNAKMSLMDATEKQFLDKFAADGSADDEEKDDTSNSDDTLDFEEDGSDLDFEEDGSDFNTDENNTPDDQGGEDFSIDFNSDDSNPFATNGADNGGEPSNPFESLRPKHPLRKLNESQKPKRKLIRKK